MLIASAVPSAEVKLMLSQLVCTQLKIPISVEKPLLSSNIWNSKRPSPSSQSQAESMVFSSAPFVNSNISKMQSPSPPPPPIV